MSSLNRWMLNIVGLVPNAIWILLVTHLEPSHFKGTENVEKFIFSSLDSSEEN